MSSAALSHLAKIGKMTEPMNRAEIDRILVMVRKCFAGTAIYQVPSQGR